jgi:hypothetical protein
MIWSRRLSAAQAEFTRNSSAQPPEDLYIESHGGFSRGPVVTDEDAQVLPPTSYIENGQTQTWRGRRQRVGGDAFDVTTESQSKDNWAPGFKVRMQMPANN